MIFGEASDVRKLIRAGDDVARERSENRARVNRLFNGSPMVDQSKAERMGIKINCNFGEGPRLAQHGNRQYRNNFLTRQYFYKLTMPDAPPDKQADWDDQITRWFNKPLKQSRAFYELHRNRWASVFLHGIAPQIWQNKFSWLADFVSIDNLRVPTDTDSSFNNLKWFAEWKPYTEGELARKVFGNNASKGWKKEFVKEILDKYHDKNVSTGTWNWSEHPEKLWELIKQSYAAYTSDSVPTIPLWHFYYYDESDPKNCVWKMCVITDNAVLDSRRDEFLYESPKPRAKQLSEILHCQFGDLGSSSPSKYWSTRGFGFLLMEPIFWGNMTLCRQVQHAWENMNVWYRVQDPTGRGKARKLEFFDQCKVPEGVSIVPADQRHQVDAGFIFQTRGELKQLQQEASASYAPETEVANKRADETATATMARVSQVNAMMSGLINSAVAQEVFAGREILRRFCLKGSTDPDVKEFQRRWRKAGIPTNLMDPEYIDLIVDVPLGNGNPVAEQAAAQQLMQYRPAYGPEAQQEILHEVTVVLAGSEKAKRWAPTEDRMAATDAEAVAEALFGTLMLGVPVKGNPSLSPIQQVEVLLGLMAGVITRITKTGGMATMGEVAGLQNTSEYINNLITLIAGDQKERARQYADDLGNLDNEVKGFAQRLQEQANAATNPPKEMISAAYKDLPPDVQRQVEASWGLQPSQNGQTNTETLKLHKAAVGLATKEASAAQRRAHDQQAFELEQRRLDSEAYAEIQRENAKLHAELEAMKAKEIASAAMQPKKETPKE